MNENEKIENPNAFPTMEHGFDRVGCPIVSTYEGMTLRDYFANSAMQGIMVGDNPTSHHPETVARWSYSIADAMLKQRSQN